MKRSPKRSVKSKRVTNSSLQIFLMKKERQIGPNQSNQAKKNKLGNISLQNREISVGLP